ncbi:hypothetical protein [Nocardiopsis sp. NPDC057823]|uniref:hypothetical protein n=1 Tax=Nocardiopsis sp. NPDC057823 TaxID=3346256 RepID=UPI00366DBF0B
MNLHIIVYNADEPTRNRAVRALNQAGIHPEDAWLDPRTAADVHTAQDGPADAGAQARAFEAGARRGLEIALDEARRPGTTLYGLRDALARMAAAPADYLEDEDVPTPTRDPVGIAVAGLITIPAAATAAWLATMGGWWWAGAITAGAVALFGVLGFVVSWPKKIRDAKGDPAGEGHMS